MTHPNLESALYAIPAHDRDIWVRMAMAVKAALGDDGFAVWDKWSQQANSYASRDARSVWRSVRPNGGITVGSLYAEAKANGWEGEPVNPRPTPAERRRRAAQAAQAARERQETERRHKEAGKRAEQMIEAATLERHPYLAAKGFPTHQGLALNGALLVPMRDFRSGRLLTLQLIQLDGSKKFLAGGRAKGAAYRLGSHQTRWYCEGYATGLSIAAALRTYLYRRDQVVVCFSAGNLAYVASESRLRGRRPRRERSGRDLRPQDGTALLVAAGAGGCERLPPAARSTSSRGCAEGVHGGGAYTVTALPVVNRPLVVLWAMPTAVSRSS